MGSKHVLKIIVVTIFSQIVAFISWQTVKNMKTNPKCNAETVIKLNEERLIVPEFLKEPSFATFVARV